MRKKGLAASSDAAILDVARQEERVVITLDADFHALLALSAGLGPAWTAFYLAK